jgi:hypothetical protein
MKAIFYEDVRSVDKRSRPGIRFWTTQPGLDEMALAW